MKKILALLLAAVMCFSLAACGGETSNTDDTSSTEQLGGESTENDTNENTESPYSNHPLLVYLYGQWKLRVKDNYQQDEEIPCSALTINEDGTCVVDGVSGTWDFSDETRDDFLIINIFVDGEHRFTSAYYERYKSIGVWSAGYNGPVDTSWLNMTTTEAITLTTDNWRDYFELVTEPRYEEDAFGDLYRLVLVQYIALKEEYASNVVCIDDVFAELKSTATRYYITLDAANDSYTLGDAIEEIELTAETRALSQYEGIYKIEVFGNNYIMAADNADPNSSDSKKVILVKDISDIEFLRVKGTIYITKQ